MFPRAPPCSPGLPLVPPGSPVFPRAPPCSPGEAGKPDKIHPEYQNSPMFSNLPQVPPRGSDRVFTINVDGKFPAGRSSARSACGCRQTPRPHARTSPLSSPEAPRIPPPPGKSSWKVGRSQRKAHASPAHGGIVREGRGIPGKSTRIPPPTGESIDRALYFPFLLKGLALDCFPAAGDPADAPGRPARRTAGLE